MLQGPHILFIVFIFNIRNMVSVLQMIIDILKATYRPSHTILYNHTVIYQLWIMVSFYQVKVFDLSSIIMHKIFMLLAEIIQSDIQQHSVFIHYVLQARKYRLVSNSNPSYGT